MTARLLLLPALVLALSACHEDDDVDLDAPPAFCDQFSSALTIVDQNSQQSSSFVQGEDVGFELAVTNNGTTRESLTVPDGCGQLRFEVYDSASALLWTSHDNQVCTQDTSFNVYQGSETRTFSATWDQQRRDGNAADIGDYTVMAVDRTECATALSKDGSFDIQ